MAAECGGLNFMFFGPPSPKVLDPLLSADTVNGISAVNGTIIGFYTHLPMVPSRGVGSVIV